MPLRLKPMGSLIHVADIILVVAELTVLLVMVLSFAGAGNTTAHAVALRWIKGKTAPAFWGGMVCCGLALPLACYLVGGVTSEPCCPHFRASRRRALALPGGLFRRTSGNPW